MNSDHSKEPNPSELDLSIDENGIEEFEENMEKKSKKLGSLPFWVISGAVHALILMLLVFLVFHYDKEKKDDLIISTAIIEDVEEKEEEIKEVEILKQVVEIQEDVIVETPVVTEEEVVEQEVQTENEMEAETAEGVSEAISDLPLVGSGLNGNIGGGGGGGGSFGQRAGGGKRKAVMRNGGSRKTESAVDLGLMWLAKNQEANGSWDTKKHGGRGTGATDLGSSGCALLAFLGAGYTDNHGKYKDTVGKAIEWILKNQNADGSWGDTDKINYSSGVCTMALSEALGMGCKDRTRIKAAVEKGVDYILGQQITNSGGFKYSGPGGAGGDMSVIGWCAMGLKSALLAGVKENEIKKSFEEINRCLNEADLTKDNTSTTKGLAWYQFGHGGGEVASACQAIALLMRQYIGWKRFEPWMTAAAGGQLVQMPKNIGSMNIYRTYYAFLSLFQYGGDTWKTWNESVSKVVVDGQRQDGDFKGSWDFNTQGHVDWGGRVLSTALLVMSLEVYYRYQSVYK